MKINRIFFYIFLCSQILFSQTNFWENSNTFANANFEYWKVGDHSINQFALPITYLYPVNDQLKLDLTTTPAFSSRNDVTRSASYNGLSDMRVRGSYLFPNEQMMATFGVNVPSGKNKLTVDELWVATALATHALQFTNPILGQGMDISGGFIYSQPVGPVVIGAGVGYHIRGAFEYTDALDFKYNPGDEFNLSLGVDYPLNRQDKLMIDLSYNMYGKDKLDNTEIFQAGNRINFTAMAYFPREIFSYFFRLKNRMQTDSKGIVTGATIPDPKFSHGNELDLLGMGILTYNRQLSFRGQIDTKFYSNNKDAAGVESGASTVFGLGGGASYQLNDMITLDGDIRFYFGSLELSQTTLDLFGLKLFSGIKINL